MSLDRHILAVAEKFPITSSAVNAGIGSWAFWETLMQRGTTVLTFAAALGGFVMFVYNVRAARRKKAKIREVRCRHCGHEEDK